MSMGGESGIGSMYVDDRAGSVDLIPHLPTSIPTSLTRLPYGDVMWCGNGEGGCPVPIGVEYKRISDLCQCIVTGRLSGHQLIGLVNEYWRVYLLVEGIWRGNPEDGILEVWKRGGWYPLTLGSRRFMYKEVANYLNTLSVMCGVIVWCTERIEASGKWLACTYRWWEKGWEDHHSIHQFNSTPPPRPYLRKPNLVHRVAKELDGVGWDKGEAISRKYGTIKELAEADEKGLQEVDGIGKVLAGRIIKQIRGG